MKDECRCPPASHYCEPVPPEPDWRSDREEAALDATVRFHHPENYRGIPKDYL